MACPSPRCSPSPAAAPLVHVTELLHHVQRRPDHRVRQPFPGLAEPLLVRINSQLIVVNVKAAVRLVRFTRYVVHEVAEDLLAERLVVMGVEDVRVPDLIDERGGLEQARTTAGRTTAGTSWYPVSRWYPVSPDGHKLEVLLSELLEVIRGVPVEVINAPGRLPILVLIGIVILRCKVKILIHVWDREVDTHQEQEGLHELSGPVVKLHLVKLGVVEGQGRVVLGARVPQRLGRARGVEQLVHRGDTPELAVGGDEEHDTLEELLVAEDLVENVGGLGRELSPLLGGRAVVTSLALTLSLLLRELELRHVATIHLRARRSEGESWLLFTKKGARANSKLEGSLDS